MTHDFDPKTMVEPENDTTFRARTPKDVSQDRQSPNRDERATLHEEDQKLSIRTPAVGDFLEAVEEGCPVVVSWSVVDDEGEL